MFRASVGAKAQDLHLIHPNEFLANANSGNLKFLSFNIQVGIRTAAYHHYLTRSWQHFLPHRGRERNLMNIADIVKDFDVIALQEADGGSLRSGFINQVRFLAEQTEKPYWYQQLNRNLGVVAQHSNGLISRYRPHRVEDHKLPGYIPGRGAILVQLGKGKNALIVVMMHLALGKGGQNKQLQYIRDLIGNHRHVVLMGDMNTYADKLLYDSPLKDLNLQEVDGDLYTFPSWRPERGLDHILVSGAVKVRQVGVLKSAISDHLPIAMEIEPPVPLRN